MTIQQRDRRHERASKGSSFSTRLADRGERKQRLDRIRLREVGL